ncbi:HGGxSTG domain-containing protein [Dickeya oryzae]|uniref:HGGxSTG domain-containing protein n=1 Tax=Dickeya oryzae TaxID=1240404 RepID=UPI001FED327A|nr:HGGxSTG domain-containing protein [Dickeya oryzae]
MNDRKRLLKRYQAHHDRKIAEHRAWAATGYDPQHRPPLEPYPDELRGLQCCATTRAGTPCKRTDIYRNGRCKYHGGKSTGAKTPEGKARQLAGYRRWLENKRKTKPLWHNVRSGSHQHWWVRTANQWQPGSKPRHRSIFSIWRRIEINLEGVGTC